MSNEFKYEFGDIDWDYWSLKPFPTNWEVAGLVCNIPPDELNCNDQFRELEFSPLDWCGKEEEFRKKLSLISENAPYAEYDASEIAGWGRVDMKQFLIWVKAKTKWILHAELEKIATGFLNEQATKPKIQGERDKPKSPREETNDLRLIGALLEIIRKDEVYKSDAELIRDLTNLYKSPPFKERTLQERFSDAKKELKNIE